MNLVTQHTNFLYYATVVYGRALHTVYGRVDYNELNCLSGQLSSPKFSVSCDYCLNKRLHRKGTTPPSILISLSEYPEKKQSKEGYCIIISASGRLRRKDHEFKACLGYVIHP